MQVKALRFKDIIFLEFKKIQDMRLATFRFLFYHNADPEEFKKCVHKDSCGGVWSHTSDFYKYNLPANMTKKELKVYNLIMGLTEGKLHKYQLIIYPKKARTSTVNHELFHHFYSSNPMFKAQVREIAKSFYKLESIKKAVSTFCEYLPSELLEESIAYIVSKEQGIPYKERNAKKFKKIIKLFEKEKDSFFKP